MRELRARVVYLLLLLFVGCGVGLLPHTDFLPALLESMKKENKRIIGKEGYLPDCHWS
jgi:hypothetical protein